VHVLSVARHGIRMMTLRDSLALLSLLVTRRESFCTPASAEQVLTNALPFQ
jgi:hypothetical protein